jgi:hypothetical protein
VNQLSTRDKQILQLRSQGLTLEAIGQQFGLTKERVRQIVSAHKIARRYTTIPELMNRFHVERYDVEQAMKAAGLSQPTPRPRRRQVLSTADVANIARQLKQLRTRRCRFCGRAFEVERGKRFCSPACFREHRRRRRSHPSEQGMRPTTQRIHDLLEAEPPGSTWVPFTEALRLCGMTKAQLRWLPRAPVFCGRQVFSKFLIRANPFSA